MHPFTHILFRLMAGLGLLGLIGCSTVERPLEAAADAMTGYRPEVLQGNVISREQVQALRPGMSPQQVRDILGTPLVQSVFHAERWDYAFTVRRERKTVEQRHLSVFFKQGRFERVEGDEMPSEAEFAAAVTAKNRDDQKPTSVPALVATPDQLQRAQQAREQALAKSPQGLVRAAPKTYPDLDSTPQWANPGKAKP